MTPTNNIQQKVKEAETSATGFSAENLADSAQAAEWTPGTVAEVAYRRYEERGRVDGYALDDWLEAETIVCLYHKLAA